MSGQIDVLADIETAAKYLGLKVGTTGGDEQAAKLLGAIDAVRDLIEAATRANGDHSAPHDCYATGPLTGDAFRDLVSCPGCELSAALARAGVAP